MHRFICLPVAIVGLAVCADCGGVEFATGDASAEGSASNSGSGGGSGSSTSSSGVSGNGSSGGSSSGGRTGSSSSASSGAGGGNSSGSHGSSASSSGGSGGNSGSSGAGSSSSGSSGSSGSTGGSSGSGGGIDAGHSCLSTGCDAAATCCGLSCCATNQLCCTVNGPVPPVDPYYCYTPTASQPTCPVGCSPKCVSDRAVKRDVEPVDEQAVLHAVSQMPLSTWSYRSDNPSTRHLGPMAQDFYAAFGLGDSDRSYDPIDAHGVAFAAIKALHEQLQRQSARIEQLELENRELSQRPVCR